MYEYTRVHDTPRRGKVADRTTPLGLLSSVFGPRVRPFPSVYKDTRNPLPPNIRSTLRHSFALTMWLLVLAGLLAVSVGEETIANVVAKKTESSSINADDIVMLEIDVKEPVKRSPVSGNAAAYGGSSSQFTVRHGDDSQQLSPEYLAVLRQFTGTEPQPYVNLHNAPQRNPLPPYAKQQQALQQAYYNNRKPAVAPPRPRPQLYPQTLPQNPIAALQPTHGPSGASTYQVESYSSPKLGSFEQELLQLVSANQAQEFNLIPTQPKNNYPQQGYAKPTAAPTPQLPEQYHIETSPPPRYPPQQRVAATYQSIEQPVQIQYQTTQADYSAKNVQPFRPSPQYDYGVDDGSSQVKAQAQAQAQAQAEAEANARAQAHAEAQALAFQKIAQESYRKHHEAAIEQIRIDHERYREQQTALEQIQQGDHVSEAGRAHREGRLEPKDPEAAYRAKLKAQAAAEAAEARRIQTEAEYKAHSDAVRQVEAQQVETVKAQERAHHEALNFERNQMRAQAQAQALAQAQAEALYKVYQQSRAKANSEILAAARAQAEAKKANPEGTPVIQYLLPSTPKLPPPNSYFTNDDTNKYQASGSTYAPRSVAKPDSTTQGQIYVQPVINQPRQAHKLKTPATSQSPVYVSQSGLLKKSPVKSLTVEEIIDQERLNGPQVVRIPSPKAQQQSLTHEELSALIDAGYSVTPIPQTVKSSQRAYAPENIAAAAYYLKKQRPVARPEYVTYEQIAQRSPRPTRKNAPANLDQVDANASEKITYLVPLEPSFGTRQPPLRNNE